MDTPLHIAASNNKFNFIREFLANEKLLTSSNKTPTVVNALDAKGHTALFNAILNGHLKSVEALIFASSDDIDVTLADANGNTIYHICAETNNFEAMRFLLTRKDSKYEQALHVTNHNGEHVIHTACLYGNLEIVRLVLSRLDSPEAYLAGQNHQGLTAFHIACTKGHFSIVEFFLKDLKMNFFLDMLDARQNTCLHLACMHNHLSLVSNILYKKLIQFLKCVVFCLLFK